MKMLEASGVPSGRERESERERVTEQEHVFTRAAEGHAGVHRTLCLHFGHRGNEPRTFGLGVQPVTDLERCAARCSDPRFLRREESWELQDFQEEPRPSEEWF